MSAEESPNLGLPYIMAAQAQKHVTHNEAVRALDIIVQLSVADRDLTTPPGTPIDGAAYIVAGGATDAWDGKSGQVAAFQDGAWMFYPPREGWTAWVADEDLLYAYDGAAWVAGGGASVNPAPLVGVNATADTTNRLSINAPASLFNHDGSGHQQKINKAATTDTASQLYQVGFSGRAEIGLTGDDDFHFKVSADGSNWLDALVLIGATGTPRFPSFASANLPSANAAGAGSLVFVPDAAGGAGLAVSDGTNWLPLTGGSGGGSQISVTPPTLDLMGKDQITSQQFAATGGTAPYTFAVTGGTLPTGLFLSSGGVLSGTPGVVAPYSFTVTATDSASLTGQRTLAGQITLPVPMLIATGGSNAGGFALNSDPSPAELAARSAVQILNNTSLNFEDLDVGSNNLIGHAGLADNATHGLEIGIANAAAAGRWPGSQVFMVKTGQGGSRVAEWASGHASGYWSTFLTRINAARTEMQTAGRTFRPVVLYSQGINDAIDFAGTNAPTTAAWKADTVAHIAKIRAELGVDALIILTKFAVPPMSTGNDVYNTVMDEIATADPNTVAIETTDATLRDGNHWDYTGLLVIAERMVDEIVGASGTLAAPTFSPTPGTYSGAQSVALSGPAGAEIRYTETGEIPTSHSALYSAPIAIPATATINAVAFQQGWRQSTRATGQYVVATAAGWDTGDATAGNFALSNNNKTFLKATSPAAYKTLRGLNSHATGKRYVEFKSGDGWSFHQIGLVNAAFNSGSHIGASGTGAGFGHATNDVYKSGGIFTSTGSNFLDNHALQNMVYQIAVDFDAGKAWLGKDNIWLGSGDPAAGTNPAITFSSGAPGALFPAMAAYDGTEGSWTLQELAADQTFSPPSGFSRWA